MSVGSNNVKRGANLERRVARFLGGRRFWVSSGERIDVESRHFLVQCKKVKTLSLNELINLAEEMEGWANTDRCDNHGYNWRDKVGVVAVELNREIRQAADGKKIKNPTVYVLTQDQLAKLFKLANFEPGVLHDEIH